jgi:ElaB/YqjD/DUF883 family membrane-anchored ribosome-binding protein
MARRTRRSGKTSKPGRASKLAKSVLALAATALVEKAIQKAAQDPKIRRKVEALIKAAEKRVRGAGKKVSRAAKSAAKRGPKVRRAAAKKMRNLVQR